MKSIATVKSIALVILILPAAIKFLLPPSWETPQLKLFANVYIVVLTIVAAIMAAQRLYNEKEHNEFDRKYPWVYLIVIIAALLICYFNIAAFAKTLNSMN